jgi:hypothetical protein
LQAALKQLHILSLTLRDSPFNNIMSWFKRLLISHNKHVFSFMNLLLSYKKHIFTITHHGQILDTSYQISLHYLEYLIWSTQHILSLHLEHILHISKISSTESLLLGISSIQIIQHIPYSTFVYAGFVWVWKGISWLCIYLHVTANDDDVTDFISHLVFVLTSGWIHHMEWRNQHKNNVQRWHHQ